MTINVTTSTAQKCFRENLESFNEEERKLFTATGSLCGTDPQ
jgi:hypothetical protein